MKSKVIAFLAIGVILITSTPIYASTNVNSNIIVDADSIEDIKVLEEEFVDEINSTLLSNDTHISGNDIDYNKMITLYTDIELYKNGKPDNARMQEAIKDSKYVYYLPIDYNEKSILVCIQKDKDTEKWHIASMGFQSVYIDYKGEVEKLLKANNIENSYVYFVNDLTDSITMGALICSDDSDNVWFKILKQFESKTNDDGGSTLDKNCLYSYENIKKIADSEIEAYRDGFDGAWSNISILTDNSKIIIISAVAGAAVLAIAIAAICIAKKKKAEKVTEE